MKNVNKKQKSIELPIKLNIKLLSIIIKYYYQLIYQIKLNKNTALKIRIKK